MPEQRITDRVVIWIFFIMITPLNLKNEIKFDHQKDLVIGDRGAEKTVKRAAIMVFKFWETKLWT
jgi:hypothetical protein